MCPDCFVTYVPGLYREPEMSPMSTDFTILDALEAMALFDEANLKQARDLLERVVSMLTGLIKP